MTTSLATTANTQISTGQTFDVSILAGTRTDSTIKMYERDFAAYAEHAGSFARAMQPETLAQWRTHLAGETDKSPNTINRMLSAVRALVAEAAAQGYVSHDTAEQFKRVKGVKVAAMRDRQRAHAKTWLAPEQMRAICDSPDVSTLAGLMHRALLLTLATSGVRVAEAVNMKFADIELSTEENKIGYVVLVAGKNKAEPTPRSLGVEAYNSICVWLSARDEETDVDSEYIFTGFSGRGSRDPRSEHICTVSAWELVKRYAAAAGVEHVKPHDFRRFVASELGECEGIKAAQVQLGHANIATTAGYMRDKPALGGTDNLF